MRAVVLAANERLEVKEVPDAGLELDECRIRIRAAGVCSSDVPRAFDGGAYHYPVIIGHEMAGEIAEVGPAVGEDFEVGNRVAIFPLLPCRVCEACARKAFSVCANYSYYGSRRDGGFAERLNVKAWNLLPVPDHVSLDDAALLEPTSVVIHALTRAGLLEQNRGGGEVAIIGAGFLGLIAVHVLAMRRPGVAVTLVDRNQYKLDMAASLGVACHRLDSAEEWAEFLTDNGTRFPIVIEACGAPETYSNSIELAAPNGTVVWMGNISGDLTLGQALVSSILRKELHVKGTWNSGYDGREASDWTVALGLMAEGLAPSSFVSLHVDLDGLPEALRRLNEHRKRVRRHEIIKVMLKVYAD